MAGLFISGAYYCVCKNYTFSPILNRKCIIPPSKGDYMKTKTLLTLMALTLVVSCGKKESMTAPASMGIIDSLTGKRVFADEKQVTEQSCIDEVMQKDLGKEEVVKKILDDSDIVFCNGLRVRVKIFRTNIDDIRAYGYAESTTGKSSCLKYGKDFKHYPLLGYRGTLQGDVIKISLGGHQYTSEGKLIASEKLRAKVVKFDMANYSGEMGFFENDKLKCWAIH